MQVDVGEADETAVPAPGSFVGVGEGDGSLQIERVESGSDGGLNLGIEKRSRMV